MSKINLTIIIPTLNSYKIIGKLISSLKQQKFKEWNVLFVDGESKKKHRSYLRNVCREDKRFKYVHQKNNTKGIYDELWMKLILHIDNIYGSDDINKLSISKLIKVLEEKILNKMFLMSFCRCVYINNKKELEVFSVTLIQEFTQIFKSGKTLGFISTTSRHSAWSKCREDK